MNLPLPPIAPTLGPPPGLMIAAPRSGAGKTTVTLGLMAALRARGLNIQPFKCGPDYIDPPFHTAATGRQSLNLDGWCMREAHLKASVATARAGVDLTLTEALMGLFDGVLTPGAFSNGASAEIAALFGWPVILVLDVSGQSQTAGAVALGHARFRNDVAVAGVILNRVGSERHRILATQGVEAAGLPVLGALPRNDALGLKERHLGLVQAGETADLTQRLMDLGAFLAKHVDLDAVVASAKAKEIIGNEGRASLLAPPGQRIALAQDAAFSFLYPHILAGWRAKGAEILPFSPLKDEPPASDADAVWLPGGYPELYAGQLSQAETFRNGLRAKAETGPVHGECGGFIALGQGLVDANGARHQMAGLLKLETSFAQRKLHLGYRHATLLRDGVLGRKGARVRGHEFHYVRTLSSNDAPLADMIDANGVDVGESGLVRGRVSGTFFHCVAVS